MDATLKLFDPISESVHKNITLRQLRAISKIVK